MSNCPSSLVRATRDLRGGRKELLLVPAQRLYQAASDFDPLGPRTLAEPWTERIPEAQRVHPVWTVFKTVDLI